MNERFEQVLKLARGIVKTWDPKMKWMWGEALLGHALWKLDKLRGTTEFHAFLKNYCDYYVANPPAVNQSDTVAPALITYPMYLETKNPAYKALTDRCVDYIMNEPRLIEDSVNHLGNSPEGKIYPKSIWVDSLMMFSVFPSMYARIEVLPAMTDVAARQPRVMSKYLQDPATKLWYHSYWTKQKTHYPRRPIFWGRGNGWVVASLPMILDEIGEHPEKKTIETIFQDTCKAMLGIQRQDGGFETVLNKPGKTYRELSATALVAAGWFAGIRKGLLDKDTYLEPARRAYGLVVDALYEKDGVLHMPDISDPTIPMPLFPYLGYKLLPKRSDWSYGLAALLFAAIEEVRLLRQS